MGPIVCPISIIVLKKPIDVPTKLPGSIHTSEAQLMKLPWQSLIRILRNRKQQPKLSCEGNHKQQCSTNYAARIIGKRLLLLSEKRPIMGLETIKRYNLDTHHYGNNQCVKTSCLYHILNQIKTQQLHKRNIGLIEQNSRPKHLYYGQ